MIDFITVNWKTPELVELVVKSIRKFVKVPHEIYVVNNGDMNDIKGLEEMFHTRTNVHIVEGVTQLPNSTIPGLKKDIPDPHIKSKIDGRVLHLASYALAEGMKIGIHAGTNKYVSFIQTDVVFLNEWTDYVLPLLEDNEFVSYAWKLHHDAAGACHWSIMKRSLFDSDYLYEPGDLYPNIYYKDTFCFLSLWARKKNKNFHICRNSLNNPELKKEHILAMPHGEQAWVGGKPFLYHHGRGTSKAVDVADSAIKPQNSKHIHDLWIRQVNGYLRSKDV